MVRPLDVQEILMDMHRMRLELERHLDKDTDDTLFIRSGSVRGRNLHVFNTIRRMKNRQLWRRNYEDDEEGKVVVYITSCGIFRKVWERCKETIDLLKALNIKAEVRDMNLDPNYVDELLDRMQLDVNDRELLFDSLPTVYVNGKYFGNDCTLIQENENKRLANLLRDFHGRDDCQQCGGSGYSVCKRCRGGKKAAETFRIRLRCATCDINGIAPCSLCNPSKRTIQD